FLSLPPTPYSTSLSLHDALPICLIHSAIAAIPPIIRILAALTIVLFLAWQIVGVSRRAHRALRGPEPGHPELPGRAQVVRPRAQDRKSTRLNSSHEWISYAVVCL